MENKLNFLSLSCTIVIIYIWNIITFQFWNSLLNGVVVFTETIFFIICVSKFLKNLKRCFKTVLQWLRNITYISNKTQIFFLYSSNPCRRGGGVLTLTEMGYSPELRVIFLPFNRRFVGIFKIYRNWQPISLPSSTSFENCNDQYG